MFRCFSGNIVRFARRRVVARLNIGHSSSSKMSCRRPEVGDIVILAPGHVKELKGLFLGVSATVIQYDTNDPGLCYQVKLSPTSGSDLSETPWFSAADIVLKDPSSPIPQPIEPESNACCGSQCPDCVWVRYFESCKVYEKRTGFSISPEPPT